MSNLTAEQLAEILRDNKDKIIAFVNFENQSGDMLFTDVVADIESICIHGNLVQFEVKPFD